MSEIRVDIALQDLTPLRRYLAMDEYRMVEAAVGYLLSNPRAIKEWAAEEDVDGVVVRRAPRHYLPIASYAAERAAHEADRDPDTGCLISRLTPNAEGYAMVHWSDPGGFGYRARRRAATAARAAFTHHFGPIPDGRTITQTCLNRMCVEPSHLALSKTTKYAS